MGFTPHTIQTSTAGPVTCSFKPSCCKSVRTPGGLVFRLGGPVEGCRHNVTPYHEPGLDDTFASALLIDGQRYYIDGDSTEFIRPRLQAASQGLLRPQ